MIRQAISCDICGSEKQQTNHWFVAYESAGELRLAAWHGPKGRRTTVKHLCGQKCVHRLLDEFLAKETGSNAHTSVAAAAPGNAPATQTLSSQSSAPTRALAAVDRALTRPSSEPVEPRTRQLAWERERALLQRAERYPARS